MRSEKSICDGKYIAGESQMVQSSYILEVEKSSESLAF